MSHTHYDKARQDAHERWNTGYPHEWEHVNCADAVYEALMQQANNNGWYADTEQTSADADVIWEWIEDSRRL